MTQYHLGVDARSKTDISAITLTHTSASGQFFVGQSLLISGLASQEAYNVIVNQILDSAILTCYRGPIQGWDWLGYHWREFCFDLREKYWQALGELWECFKR